MRIRLKNTFPITIKSSFLGAHALLLSTKTKTRLPKLIKEEMLPKIDKEGLADYIDIFCEKGYFSEEMERI